MTGTVFHCHCALFLLFGVERSKGVTLRLLVARFEAHIWVKELGRQVYLGGYEHEEHAAEAYDVAALKCKGFRVKTNFDAERYCTPLLAVLHWLMA